MVSKSTAMKYFIWMLALLCACSEDETPTCQSSWVATTTEISPARCDQPNGSFTLSVPSDAETTRYRLNNGALQASPVFSNLAPGSYQVTAQNSQGCTSALTVVVPNTPTTLNLSASASPSACGQATGQLVLSATGGLAPYRYSIDSLTFVSAVTFDELLPGAYRVWVQDDAGCVTNTDVLVTSTVSFSATIQEIITTNCALQGCHVAGHPANFEVKDNIFNYAERIRERTQDGSMPLGRELTDQEISQIACWVNDGAPDN